MKEVFEEMFSGFSFEDYNIHEVALMFIVSNLSRYIHNHTDNVTLVKIFRNLANHNFDEKDIEHLTWLLDKHSN